MKKGNGLAFAMGSKTARDTTPTPLKSVHFWQKTNWVGSSGPNRNLSRFMEFILETGVAGILGVFYTEEV